jgi:large-conductance mechanosensitive channel
MKNEIFINNIKNNLKHQTIDFLNFIIDQKILTLGIGIVVGTQIYILINMFTLYIVSPIINKIFNTKEENLSKVNIEIFGIKFEIGKILSSLFNLVIVVYILYLLFKLEERIAMKYITKNK